MMALLQRVVKTYRSNVVLRSSFWYIIGTFALRGLTFGSLFIFTRLLIPDQFGKASLYLIWISPFSAIFTLYVEASVARTKFDLEWDEFTRFVSSVSFLGILTGGLCMGLLFLLPEALIQDIFGLSKPLLLLAAMTGVLFMSFRVTVTIWETTYNYKRSIPISLGVEIASITLSVILIILALSGSVSYEAAMGRITGYSVIYGAVGGYLLLYNLYRGKTFVHLPYWKSAVAYSLPILPHVIASNLLANFDRILIAQYYGPTEVGIYAFGYQLGGIALIVWAATNTAWSPWYFENMKLKNYAIIRKRTQQYLFLFTVLTVVLVIVSPALVNLLAPERYRDARHIVPMIMASGFFSLLYSFYANIEFFERKTGFISIATILSAAVNISLNLLLLPRFGYQVAAWTTLAAYMSLFLFHAFVVKVKMKELDTNNFGISVLISGFIVALVVLVQAVQQ
jgi:O-antigen/teichoic acid export membrane protein